MMSLAAIFPSTTNRLLSDRPLRWMFARLTADKHTIVSAVLAALGAECGFDDMKRNKTSITNETM